MSEHTRIVLFGINGQVGNRLLTTLTDAGYEVTGIDRKRCDFATATPKEIAIIIRAVEPQLVINAAAYTMVDLAESAPQLAQRINGDVPEMIAQACLDQNIPFLHFSTDYVFDGLRGAPYDEDASPNPLNIYARSKLAGETAARKLGAHIFRLQWVFDTRGKNFFLTMNKLLAERDELRVVADQVGSPSFARDVALAVTKAIPRIISDDIPAEIYHLRAGGHTSWHGFALAIAQATGSKASVLPIVSEQHPLPATRPKDVRLQNTKLAAFGITVPHWQQGLDDAMKELHADS